MFKPYAAVATGRNDDHALGLGRTQQRAAAVVRPATIPVGALVAAVAASYILAPNRTPVRVHPTAHPSEWQGVAKLTDPEAVCAELCWLGAVWVEDCVG